MAVTSRGAIVQCGDATGPGLAEREPRGPSPHRPRADRRDARRRARRLRQPVVLRLDRPRLHDPRPADRRALGGPKLLIGSWAGSRWIPRAAKDFDGWIGSGARSSVAALRDGIKRFREAGGQRAIATNIPVDLEAPTAPMPEEGQFHLRCDPTTAAQRLRMLADLGFDDAVLVTRRYGDADLAALRALWP